MILKIKGWLATALTNEKIVETLRIQNDSLDMVGSCLEHDRLNISRLTDDIRELNKEVFILKGDIISLQAQIVKLTNAPFTPHIDKPTSPTISTKPLRVAKKKQNGKVPGRV